MATVRELVGKAIHDAAYCSAARAEIQAVLAPLGIWDAEVYELVWDGGYGDQSEPEEYERAEFRTWDGKHFDSDAVFREGKRVRVIVIPQEEE